MSPRWLKGNLHTHTKNSDGDSSPNTVVAWYRDHAYDFLSLTDHNQLTEPESVDKASLGDMFLVPGEEVSLPFGVHINALNVSEAIEPLMAWWRSALNELVGLACRRPWFTSCREVVLKRRLLDAALRQVGTRAALASVNHPNYRWALDETVLRAADMKFLEIYNGHPACHTEGRPPHMSAEHLWDRLLSVGKRVYGLATDDAHDLRHWGAKYANPGRGWIMVEADRNADSIQRGLLAARFFATTGVQLHELAVEGFRIELAIAPAKGEEYETVFVSDGGRMVRRCVGLTAICQMPDNASYLRATIRSSSGVRAWIQPTFGRNTHGG